MMDGGIRFTPAPRNGRPAGESLAYQLGRRQTSESEEGALDQKSAYKLCDILKLHFLQL